MNHIRLKFQTIVGHVVRDVSFNSYEASQRCLVGKIYYRIIKLVLYILNKSCFKIMSFESYEKEILLIDSRVLQSNRLGFTGNLVYIDQRIDQVMNPHQLPDLKVHVLSDFIIAGNSDMLVDVRHKCVINDYCYYSNDPYMEMIDGLLYRSKGRMCVLRNNFRNAPQTIEYGIMISGKLSPNYYHEIYENLIRLIYVNQAIIPMNIPLIVDEVVLQIPSCKKILDYLKDEHRDVITIQKNKLYKVGKLYYIDHLNWLTPHKSVRLMNREEDFIYDGDSLHKFKTALLQYKTTVDYHKRIFLTRKGTSYRKFNESEIFEVLKEYGFEMVSPSEFTLEEQMALFSNAEWIAGATGAALANLVFCSPGAKVICFGSSKRGLEPHIFNTIAYINDCRIWYVAPENRAANASIHADFKVNVDEFSECFSKLMKDES